MLEQASRARIRRLTYSKGKPVERIAFSLTSPFSLVKVTTESANIYLIEPIEETSEFGTTVNIGRRSPLKNVRQNYLGIRVVDADHLAVGERLVYRSSERVFVTSRIRTIEMLIE
jgi:hypothetical protein